MNDTPPLKGIPLARTQVFAIVAQIPEGQVMGYGQVGGFLQPPLSGLWVGRILAGSTETLPWWRVVGADGSLLVRKRDALLAIEQEQRLQEEGVDFTEDGRVQMKRFQWKPEDLFF